MIYEKYKHLSTPDFILNQVNGYINLKPKESFDSYSFFNITSNDDTSFLYDSFRFRAKKGSPYNTIPFNVNFPTFKSMNSTQKDFYFYWRNECVQGNFIDTELSYIFLFSYELINYSFNSSAAFNVSMLNHLLERYSPRFPKINDYLPHWISDMLFELNETELANEFKAEESLLNKDYYDMRSQTSIKNITMNNWWRFVEYKHKSAFFAKNTTKIYTIFKDLLEFLDAHYQRINPEEGIFEKLFPYVESTSDREFFQDAVFKRETLPKQSSVVKREFSPSFSLLISEVMKISENYLRSIKNYELLEVDFNVIDYDLVKMMIQSLTRFATDGSGVRKKKAEEVKKEEVVIKVVFDDEHIEHLTKETDQLQQIFEEKYGEEEADTDTSFNKNEPIKAEEIFSVFKEIKNSFDFEELDELSDLEKEFILLFEHDLKPLSHYEQFLRQRGMMLGSFILTINEKFEESFEDVLFELEDDEIEFNNIFDGVFDFLKK